MQTYVMYVCKLYVRVNMSRAFRPASAASRTNITPYYAHIDLLHKDVDT